MLRLGVETNQPVLYFRRCSDLSVNNANGILAIPRPAIPQKERNFMRPIGGSEKNKRHCLPSVGNNESSGTVLLIRGFLKNRLGDFRYLVRVPTGSLEPTSWNKKSQWNALICLLPVRRKTLPRETHHDRDRDDEDVRFCLRAPCCKASPTLPHNDCETPDHRKRCRY